ncbi:hypothetical protein R70331_12055 [Paenibacillus sp. FSL R7-0331]|nr:hypothetical protein R70331_12055 [Paenibacillus sp. FSL R7-0331]
MIINYNGAYIFTKQVQEEYMNVHSLIQYWAGSSFHLFDIRHVVLRPGETLPAYPLPADAFVLLCRGEGTAGIGGHSFTLPRSCLLHGGKGLELQITSLQQLEFYLILYKSEPGSASAPLHSLAGTAEPFRFVPEFPALLHQHARDIYDTWLRGGELARFKAKTVFYMFMHEVMSQLDQAPAEAAQADVVDQAIRYIEKHLQEPVTLDAIAQELNYSVRYLSRKFKAKTGRSPIDYHIHIRMEKAARLLQETDHTVQHIAESVGYHDLFYFIKRFKKHTGAVPGQFRKLAVELQQVPDVPSKRLRSSMWSPPSLRYTKTRMSPDRIRVERGDSAMSKETKTPLAVALLLCMMILLSACGAEPSSSASPQRMQIEHAMGVTEVSGIPDRIAAADYRILDTLYALGVKPYATTTYSGSVELPYMDKEDQNEAIVPLGDKINLEAAVETEPDMIIARHIEPDVYEQLSKVAPVLVFRGDGDWREELQEIGSVVGREDEAAKWLADYDKQAAEVKQRIAGYVEPGETFLFIRLQKEMQAASPNVHLAATLTKDLGLSYVSGLEKQEESYAALSLEVLPELNPDHIFMTVGKSTVSQDEDAEKLLADMQQTAVWQKVSAIQKGNLHIMPQWVFGDYPNIKSKSLELVEAALTQPE